MGLDYGRIAVKRESGKLLLQMANCKNADKGTAEEIIAGPELNSNTVYFRVTVKKGAECQFSCSTDGNSFTSLGNAFKAREGKWIGAKVGFYAVREGIINDAGSADIDWFRVEK
jgi:hypothetical protein